MAIAPETAAPPPGLTTTKAPFIEEARAHGDIYIHQPYELYSAENQATWGALLGRMHDRWRALRERALPRGPGQAAAVAGAHPAPRGDQPLHAAADRLPRAPGQRLRPVVRVLRLPAPARVPDHDHHPRRRAAGVPARARHLPRRRRPRADAHRPRVRAGAGPLRRMRGRGGAPGVGDRRRAREAAPPDQQHPRDVALLLVQRRVRPDALGARRTAR